jgi:hypothetical protein
MSSGLVNCWRGDDEYRRLTAKQQKSCTQIGINKSVLGAL